MSTMPPNSPIRVRHPLGLTKRLAAVASSCALLAGLLLPPVRGLAQEAPAAQADQRLTLTRRSDQHGEISSGRFKVYENRRAQSGRVLELDVVVLHAVGTNRVDDPVFPLAGGPGVSAAANWRGYADSWIRQRRDIVLVSQRGTGGDNRLDLPRDPEARGVQQYLGDFPDQAVARRAVEQLSQNADLKMYSTCLAMDDLNDVRQALGYDKINLIGGSYGTRAALVYIRRHGDTVRTAILNGVAPIEFKNPLYHARGAQEALDKIFTEVETTPRYRQAFGDLRAKFREIMSRFDDGPIEIQVRDESGRDVSVQLSREAFARSLRYQLYYMNTSRRVPLMLLQAYQGDFRPFVESSIARNRALGQMVAMGMLLSVTAAEDVARIDPEEIGPATEGTFLGDRRVRNQIAACRVWPKSDLPANFGQPVQSDVPTLILSGTLDPVTPPHWGDVVARNFSNSLHLVVPGAHGVGGPCLQGIEQALLETGTVENLDTSCVRELRMPPLVLPDSGASSQ